MNTDEHRLLIEKKYSHQEITAEIINAAYKVHNMLGYGFLEKVYHNALVIELENRNFLVESQRQINVLYDEKVVGEFYADVLVDDKVIVEIKSTDTHNPLFEAQLLNYLKASGIKIGLIINFGPSVKVKRMVL